MKIVLATGIYPPDIGGPATYVRALAEELVKKHMQVTVLTYGSGTHPDDIWETVSISRFWPLLRWWQYAQALRTHAADADIVIAFSLVSVGVPLWLSGLGKPKLILRLGGDFLWERYTDLGGAFSLKEWYASPFWQTASALARSFVGSLLHSFNHIVFSTRLQEEIYEKQYRRLPSHTVIENALVAPTPTPSPAAAGEGRTRHTPFRLLFMGRFVAFKNIASLLRAMTELLEITLTLVGEGPLLPILEGNVRGLRIQDRVTFRPKVNQEERRMLFRDHDLLILPSVTEISPNTALEARAACLPVLLTEETGLSEALRQGMVIRKLRTSEQIRSAIQEVMGDYGRFVLEAAQSPVDRSWGKVCEEYLQLFDIMSSPSP